MHGTELHLSQNLIKKPAKFRPHHFSLPKNSIVIAVQEVNAGTTTRREIIHNDEHSAKTLNNAKPKRNQLSQKPDARRKRKSRSNPTVRQRERERVNAMNAQKRKEPEHEQNLARWREKRKANLLKVERRNASAKPFAALDECEGLYQLEY